VTLTRRQEIAAAIAACGFTPSERLVLLAILLHSMNDDECYPKDRRITELSGVSDRRVIRDARRKAAENGLLTVTRDRPNAPCSYLWGVCANCTVRKLHSAQTAQCDMPPGGGAQTAPPGGAQTARGGGAQTAPAN